MNQQHRNLSVCAALALGTFAPVAHAYLDPSTGSMILSAVVGILATLSLAIKTYWYKLKSFFTGNKRGTRSTQPSAHDTDSSSPASGDQTRPS